MPVDDRRPATLRLLAEALRRRTSAAPPRLARRRLTRLLRRAAGARADVCER